MRADPVDLAFYLFFATAGFLFKFALERYSSHKGAIRLQAWQLEISNLEEKLSQFYWPIYCRLRRGTIAWEAENFRRSPGKKNISSEEMQKLANSFDEQIIIKNHEETRDIIQNNFHHFGGDKRLEDLLVELIHHIDIYLALRTSGSLADPDAVGRPWPKAVEAKISEQLHKLQTKYDKLLKEASRPI